MAYINKTLNGKAFQKGIALHEGVQNALTEKALEIGVRAEEALEESRVEHVAYIEVTKGRIDRHVSLVDRERSNRTPNSLSAASIEFGRQRYVVRLVDTTGKVIKEYVVGAVEPKFILTKAAWLPEPSTAPVRARPVRITTRLIGGGRKRSVRKRRKG